MLKEWMSVAILNFSDVLKKIGLEPKEVKLIRHALSDERFRACYKAGMAHGYTQHQKEGFSKDYTYWVTLSAMEVHTQDCIPVIV